MLHRVDLNDTAKHESQRFILDYAESHSVELMDALKRFGYDLDDLVYEKSGKSTLQEVATIDLDGLARKPNDVPMVSFFSGCGGLDIGFETAGFSHLAAFEINELFCKTLRRNRPKWNVFGPPVTSGDVSNFDETVETLEKLIEPGFQGVFVGGPPCQPFSIAANQRFSKSGDKYKRTGFANQPYGNLLFDYVRFIEHFMPSCFVIENVPGVRDLDGGEQLSILVSRLSGSGYYVGDPKILNAAHFGIPQFRERLFIVGTRTRNKFAYPKEHNTLVPCGPVLPRDRGCAPNNETRAHRLASVDRYIRLDYGQRDRLGRVDRLDPSTPAKAVIAGGTAGGGRSHLHPEIPRTLSVRECARLQTFPDDFVFIGPTARQFTQVGNAVPPVLAAQIAAAIADSVFGVGRE